MAEREAVNFEVAGSNPAPGAELDDKKIINFQNYSAKFN